MPTPKKPKQRSWPKGTLKELNAFAQKLAKKARADMLSGGEGADNGPFLDNQGRIGGAFSIWADPSNTPDTSGWIGAYGAEPELGPIKPAPKPKQAPPAPDPIKKSKYGRMIKLKEKDEE